MDTIDIAQVCHEANRQVQMIQNASAIPVSEPWTYLDAETVKSAIEGVANIQDGTVLTPEDSHAQWSKFKTDHGWIYGPVKDHDKKQHPCLVPYANLPEEQQVKDHLFFAIVRALS